MVSSIALEIGGNASLVNSLLSVFGDLEARQSIVFIFEKKSASACVRSSFNVDGRDCISLACNQLLCSFLIALCWFPTCDRRNVLVSRVRSVGFIQALLYRLLGLNSFKYSS